MKLFARFQFHPIGQGCFYTGHIEHYLSIRGEFRFVYDCGTASSFSYLQKAIANYKHSVRQLDLVIISHFDRDHVNGITLLLQGIICRRLVIPYYETIERLLLYAENDGEDDGYLEMLRDPLAFFSGEQFNIQEIVVVTGGSDNEGASQNLEPTNGRSGSLFF